MKTRASYARPPEAMANVFGRVLMALVWGYIAANHGFNAVLTITLASLFVGGLLRNLRLTGTSLSSSFAWAMAVRLTLSIRSLQNDPFDVDVLNTNTVSDLRQRLFERLGLDPAEWHLKLTYDLTVLDNPTATLSAYNLKTGCCLTMVKERPGPIVLHNTINDYQISTDSSHLRPAARSKELLGTVNSIEVSAKNLPRPGDWIREVESVSDPHVWEGSACAPKHLGDLQGQRLQARQAPTSDQLSILTVTTSSRRLSQVVFYQMEYEVGHGGGHRIIVEDWVVKISYLSSSCTEPSDCGGTFRVPV